MFQALREPGRSEHSSRSLALTRSVTKPRLPCFCHDNKETIPVHSLLFGPWSLGNSNANPRKKHPEKIPDCSSVRLNEEYQKTLLYASEFLSDKSTKRHDDAFSSFFREQSWSKTPGGKWSKQHFCDTVAGQQVGPWF